MHEYDRRDSVLEDCANTCHPSGFPYRQGIPSTIYALRRSFVCRFKSRAGGQNAPRTRFQGLIESVLACLGRRFCLAGCDT